MTLYTADEDTVIVMPAEKHGFVEIRLHTWHTPETPQLELDGEALGSQDEFRFINYWLGQDYFRQNYDYQILAKDIRDGSVLTLTCGKWQYEWVFEMEDA